MGVFSMFRDDYVSQGDNMGMRPIHSDSLKAKRDFDLFTNSAKKIRELNDRDKEEDNNTIGNPDPSNFVIIFEKFIDKYTVVIVHYPDANNYEGIKILLYKGKAFINSVSKLDPHFSTNNNIVARFKPNDDGINTMLDCIFADITPKDQDREALLLNEIKKALSEFRTYNSANEELKKLQKKYNMSHGDLVLLRTMLNKNKE